MRRLRAGFVPPLPGGPEGPPGGITTFCEPGSLDWDWPKASSHGSAGDEGLCLLLRPEARSRDGAPKGARILQKRMRQDEFGPALSALHPLAFCEGQRKCPAKAGKDDGLPGAAKNMGK